MNIIESWVFFPYQIKNVTVCWLSAEHLTVLKYLALYILKKLNFPSPVHNSTRIKKKNIISLIIKSISYTLQINHYLYSVFIGYEMFYIQNIFWFSFQVYLLYYTLEWDCWKVHSCCESMEKANIDFWNIYLSHAELLEKTQIWECQNFRFLGSTWRGNEKYILKNSFD